MVTPIRRPVRTSTTTSAAATAVSSTTPAISSSVPPVSVRRPPAVSCRIVAEVDPRSARPGASSAIAWAAPFGANRA